MRKYHTLTIAGVQPETRDSVRVTIDVPEELRGEFNFQPGQHLPVQADIDGNNVRRTYSLCSVPGDLPLELGIRVQAGGRFSEYAANRLAAGDSLQAMPPFGRFHANLNSGEAKIYLAFAAGSGITPILSILQATLEQEPDSKFLLFYANRRQNSTMFVDSLQALKNRFTERLQLYFLFTQEEQEFPIFSGRLDRKKTAELCEKFCVGLSPDEAYICGPDSMIDDVRDALIDFGLDKDSVHTERYGAPRKRAAKQPGNLIGERQASVTVIMDGHKKSFEMSSDDGNIVDAAAGQGIELPFSCKGGVCATCRTHVREGEVRMATNYGLEPWEIEKGFVLACQSLPVSDEVMLDYDKT